MACVPWSMAPLAQAATLLNLGVAEGPTGAIITVQSHTPLRGLQLLAALTRVLYHVGLQGVPAGRSAQQLALLGAATGSVSSWHSDKLPRSLSPCVQDPTGSLAHCLGAYVSATASLGHQVS